MPIFEPWDSEKVEFKLGPPSSVQSSVSIMPRSRGSLLLTVHAQKYLYRIFDEKSASRFDNVKGFLPAGRDITFDVNNDPVSAMSIVERHAEWSNRDPTPLISVTNDRTEAMHLALKRLERRNAVQIAVIDYELVKEISSVHHMMSLANSLGVPLPLKAQNESEWVVVGQIPRNAVLEVLNTPSFRAFCEKQSLCSFLVVLYIRTNSDIGYFRTRWASPVGYW